MADNSVKLVTREAGVPKERDPVALMAGALPLVPIVRQGQAATVGAVLAGASVLSTIIGQDADWTIPASATHVAIPPLTASRTWRFSDVDSCPRGQDLVVIDEGGNLGGAYTITLTPVASSGDAIPNTTNNQILLSNQYGWSRTRAGFAPNIRVIA